MSTMNATLENDLLTVLKVLAAHIDDHVDINNKGGPNWAMQLQEEFGEQMRAAIAKAEGSK